MDNSVHIVILAAGLGTRMKSKKAKVLHEAGGQTLIEHVVDTAIELAPAGNIVAVVGHQADRVRETVAGRGIRFVDQKEQKGTGHAVRSCREEIGKGGGLVVVLYGDCPLVSRDTLARLIETQKARAGAATLITTTLEDPTGYGRILLDENGAVRAIVEEKPATPEQRKIRQINSGVYCFRADLLWKHIGEIEPNNPAHELYLTDMAEILHRAGHRVTPMPVADAGELLGINTRIELAEVDRILRGRKTRELMLAGVTIEQPGTVTIDHHVSVGMDSVIEPFAQLRGRTVVGEECRIGASSIVRDSQLGDRVQVFPFTIIGTSTVESDAQIGPYARLRQDNHVARGARVGNFVELKKTHLGEGSKSLHLAYLGDSEIGSKVNIGAGTITCNYDGKAKYKTRIGSGAFVGSNSTLVAPIDIGEGSYIGAGSVITEAVPADALAVGRGRQAVKEGWATKRRGK